MPYLVIKNVFKKEKHLLFPILLEYIHNPLPIYPIRINTRYVTDIKGKFFFLYFLQYFSLKFIYPHLIIVPHTYVPPSTIRTTAASYTHPPMMRKNIFCKTSMDGCFLCEAHLSIPTKVYTYIRTKLLIPFCNYENITRTNDISFFHVRPLKKTCWDDVRLK